MATRLYFETSHARKLLVYGVGQHDWEAYLAWQDALNKTSDVEKGQEIYESASDTTQLIHLMELFGFGRVKSRLAEGYQGSESVRHRVETILRDQFEGQSEEQTRMMHRAMGLARSNRLTVYWC